MPATNTASTRHVFAASAAVSPELARKRNRIAAALMGPRAGFVNDGERSYGFIPNLGAAFVARWTRAIEQAWAAEGATLTDIIDAAKGYTKRGTRCPDCGSNKDENGACVAMCGE